MTGKQISFTLDGCEVSAGADETIWQVAKRHNIHIPHLCLQPEPGYKPQGNCRACMVEIAGEQRLSPSCSRQPAEGMVVETDGPRAKSARKMIFELLASEMPAQQKSPDPEAFFWRQAAIAGFDGKTRFAGQRPGAQAKIPQDSNLHDPSHPSIAVNMDACIACELCRQACSDIQVNDIIAMAYRGDHARPVFDFDDPIGLSACPGCGECVQICPTGALFEKTLMDEAAVMREVYADKSIDTLCPFCGVGCQTKVYVKNSKIVQIDGRGGPANNKRLCIKGRFGYDYAASPERLTKPLIRREDARKDGNMKLEYGNISRIFREATWQEALQKAAEGFKNIKSRDGGAALAGFGSAKGSNEEAYLFQKLIRQGFGSNNVDHCTRLCHASSVAALFEGIGTGAVTAPFTAALDADCIIVIGARPEQNHPVAASYIKQAAIAGARLIVIDPRKQGLMRHAEHSLIFTPGRDVALLNAVINVIISEKLYNADYIAKHVSGFAELAERVEKFTPEAMAPICGIAPDEIRKVARLYAGSKRSIIFWGMGISQHVHGTDNARALIAMALITGHIGRPGTGLHPLRGQNNVQGASDAGLIPMFYPDYKPVHNPHFRALYQDLWKADLDPEPGLSVVEIINAAYDGQIKGMYIMGENPAMSDPDAQHARGALARLEHLVVQDIFLTQTAWHADVILPASAHIEKRGSFTNTNRQIQMGRPALTPPGKARQDWELICQIAKGIGLEWNYKNISDVYAEMRMVMRSLDNIPWSRLEREDCVTFPAKSENEPGSEILFGDGFPTPDGRGRIIPADLLPPDELPDDDFPLVLTTGRMLEHWHTGAISHRSGALKAHEPDAVVSMHPKDIAKNCLERGQMVIVETRRGNIRLRLRADRDISRGMIFIPFCFPEAPANMLTNPKLDPFGKIPEFKFCAARILSL